MKQLLNSIKLLAVCALVLGAGTACSKRYIQDVSDHGSGDATLVETLDTKNFAIIGVRKYVFWECREGKDTMTCTRVCDRKDEQGAKVLCPKSYVWPW